MSFGAWLGATEKLVTVPAVVTRPTEPKFCPAALLDPLVIHMAPSGPSAISDGEVMGPPYFANWPAGSAASAGVAATPTHSADMAMSRAPTTRRSRAVRERRSNITLTPAAE